MVVSTQSPGEHEVPYSGIGATIGTTVAISLNRCLNAAMISERELWAAALWVEKHHGANGPKHIADQVGRLAKAGDSDGVAMSRQVADRYDRLIKRSALS